MFFFSIRPSFFCFYIKSLLDLQCIHFREVVDGKVTFTTILSVMWQLWLRAKNGNDPKSGIANGNDCSYKIEQIVVEESLGLNCAGETGAE